MKKKIAVLMIKIKNKNEIIITPSSIKHNQNEYISYKKQYEGLFI